MILQKLLSGRALTQSGGDPGSPQYWLQKLFGGGPESSAGVVVNQDTALNCSALFCGVTILSDLIKTLPFKSHQRMPNGDKREAREHPSFKLLHRKFNPVMSARRARKFMEACRVLWSAGYAEIVRNPRGQGSEMWPLHPTRVRPWVDLEGLLWYEVENGQGKPKTMLPDRDMFRVVWYTEDGITTKSVVDVAAESLGLTLAAERYGSTFFGNDARPGGIVKHPTKMTPEQYDRLKEGMQEFKEPGKRLSTLILEEGGEWQPVGMPNEAIQFLETRQHQVTEWARWLNMPPHMLKDLLRATFSNIEEQSISFMTDTAEPNLTEWEDEAWMKLFTEKEQEAGFFAEFNRTARLRGDSASRSTYYRSMWDMGGLSTNEIRSMENMNGIGPDGDERFVQLNLTTLSKAAADDQTVKIGKPPPPPGDGDEEDDDRGRFREWVRPILREAVARLRRKEIRWLKANRDKLTSDSILDFCDRHRPMVSDALGTVADSVTRAGIAEVEVGALCEGYLRAVRDSAMEALRDGAIDEILSGMDTTEVQADAMLACMLGDVSCSELN